MRFIKKNDFKTSDWSGGETSELMIFPEGKNFKNRDFEYRISSATCNLDFSKFSDFSGYKRFITPLDKILILKVNGEEIKLEPFEILEFSGSDDVSSHSKVRDFNLIVKDGISANMYSEKIDKDLNIKSEEDKTYIFNYNSNLYVDGDLFEEMSLIILEKGESVTIKGKGRILICSL
ncbi:MAG: HutD family protein [Peptoniphilaceae bacterium]